jgi:hypothetical protein
MDYQRKSQASILLLCTFEILPCRPLNNAYTTRTITFLQLVHIFFLSGTNSGTGKVLGYVKTTILHYISLNPNTNTWLYKQLKLAIIIISIYYCNCMCITCATLLNILHITEHKIIFPQNTVFPFSAMEIFHSTSVRQRACCTGSKN